jgi:hypothetical protein
MRRFMQKTYTEAEESLLKEWGNERDFELEDAEVLWNFRH